MRLTIKQTQIMTVVLAGNDNEEGVTISWCDMQELIERLPYTVTRDALQFSLRYLEKKGLLDRKHSAELRRHRRRTLYVPTNLAFDMFRGSSAKEKRFDSVVLD